MTVAMRLASDRDIPAVQRFLDRHWARGHVLANDRQLLDFQHRADDGRYHLAIAGGQNGEVVGLLGGILTSTYDPALAARDTLWLTTWKVAPEVSSAGLGLRLHSLLTGALDHAAVGTVGNNQAASQIYRLLGYRTGELEHYALIDPRRENLRLAVRGAAWPRSLPTADRSLRLHQLDRERLITLALAPLGERQHAHPAKSPEYFVRRYLDHPRFDYAVMSLERARRPTALLAVRQVAHRGARALRLVDYLGPTDGLAGASAALHRLLERFDAEYIDCYAHGLDRGALADGGLLPLDPAGETVVPSYFEPFEQRNVRLRFAFHSHSGEAAVLLKADADQDRPNRPAESAP